MVPDVNSHKKSRFQVVANFRAHWNVTMYKMQVRQRIIIDKKEIKLNYIYVLYVHIWECLWESNIHVWSPLICSRSEMKEVSKLSGFRLYQFDNDLLTIYWFDMKNVISFSLTCLFCYLHWFAKTEVLEGHQTHRSTPSHHICPTEAEAFGQLRGIDPLSYLYWPETFRQPRVTRRKSSLRVDTSAWVKA